MSNVHDGISDKLFAKYRNSPNILKVLEILSDPLQDANDAVDYILDHLSIDEAEGELLDYMASMIGVVRPPAQETDMLRLFGDSEIADGTADNHGLAPDDLSTGGYLSGDQGKMDPDDSMDDETFRGYIRAKANAFRVQATREAMYTYVLQFGIRSRIVEDTRDVRIEPYDYGDLDHSLRYHVENRGFNPAGIRTIIKPQSTPTPEV